VESLRCSFCDKPREQVRRLIAGKGVCICNECVGLCNDLLAEETQKRKRVAKPGATKRAGRRPARKKP